MGLNQVLKVGIGVAIAAAWLGTAAHAADMPLYDTPVVTDDAPPPQPQEFGTGWYLRGDGAYANGDHPKFDAALGTFDRKGTSSGYAFGIGAGYKLNSFVRMDITADYMEPFDYSGQGNCGTGCGITSRTHVWRWNGLANGYLDLGTWSGITPYVGAGAGVSGTRQDQQQTITTAGVSVSQNPASANDYEFAWAAMAGVSYALEPHVVFDVGYRYIDLGRTTITLNPLASTRKDLSAHQVRVGMRYMID